MNPMSYELAACYLERLANQIVREKRPAYTAGSSDPEGNADVLDNFKRGADRLGVTLPQSWGIHFQKQVDAVTAWARNPAIPQAEPMPYRFADLFNYVIIGLAVWLETQDWRGGEPIPGVAPEDDLPLVAYYRYGDQGPCERGS